MLANRALRLVVSRELFTMKLDWLGGRFVDGIPSVTAQIANRMESKF